MLLRNNSSILDTNIDTVFIFLKMQAYLNLQSLAVGDGLSGVGCMITDAQLHIADH